MAASTQAYFIAFCLLLLGFSEVQSAPSGLEEAAERNYSSSLLKTGRGFKSDLQLQRGAVNGNCRNCGVKFPANRIIFGLETGVNEWPWQVYLQIHTPDAEFSCGGSLYKTKYVISAAHCFSFVITGVRAIVGAHEIEGGNEPEQQIIPVWSIKNHPRWEKNPDHTNDNDIAILELSRPVVFTDRVRPICLPEANDDFTGKKAWATGWGLTSGFSTSNELLETELTIWDEQSCLEKDNTINMLCATGKREGLNTNTCKGDSGGPLSYQKSDGTWVLAGVVSYGSFPCANPNIPTAFTKVSNYLDWIHQTTAGGQC